MLTSTKDDRVAAHRAEMAKRRTRRDLRDKKGAVVHAHRTSRDTGLQRMWFNVWTRLDEAERGAR